MNKAKLLVITVLGVAATGCGGDAQDEKEYVEVPAEPVCIEGNEFYFEQNQTPLIKKDVDINSDGCVTAEEWIDTYNIYATPDAVTNDGAIVNQLTADQQAYIEIVSYTLPGLPENDILVPGDTFRIQAIFDTAASWGNTETPPSYFIYLTEKPSSQFIADEDPSPGVGIVSSDLSTPLDIPCEYHGGGQLSCGVSMTYMDNGRFNDATLPITLYMSIVACSDRTYSADKCGGSHAHERLILTEGSEPKAN